MPSASDYKEKIKNDRGIGEHIALLLPGYRGYRQKELRRDTDQLIRNTVYNTLETALRELRACYREIINLDMGHQRDIKRIISKTDKTNEKIRHAKRGYSGIWQSIKVGLEELDVLIEYDYSILSRSHDYFQNVVRLKEIVRNKDEQKLSEIVPKLEDLIDEFDEIFKKRDEVILGLSEIDISEDGD